FALMNQNLKQTTRSSADRPPPQPERARTGFLVMVLLIGAIAIGAGLFAWNNSRKAGPEDQGAQSEEAPKAHLAKAAAQDPEAIPEPSTIVPPPAAVNPSITA